jgi:hypothetical protein
METEKHRKWLGDHELADLVDGLRKVREWVQRRIRATESSEGLSGELKSLVSIIGWKLAEKDTMGMLAYG